MSSRKDYSFRKRCSKIREHSENDSSSDTSEQSEGTPSPLQHTDKIDRWVNLLNCSENINVAFLKILGEIEYNILQNLEEFQKKINDRIESKLNSVKGEKIYPSIYVKQLKDKLNVTLPIHDLQVFEKFNADLEEDIEKQNALREYFEHLMKGSSSLSNDVYLILSGVFTKSVQIHYSGVGKTHCKKTKKNFSITSVYLCMQDVLIDKYKTSIKELKLISKVSRWLSQNGDRIDRPPVFRNKRTRYLEDSSTEQNTE